jgi:quercetin dioxygenase-like cupin family protein
MTEENFYKATAQRPMGNRVIDALVVKIDLPLFIKLLKDEKAWQESDRNAITVLKTSTMTILLIALHKGAKMPDHSVPGMSSVQVVKGVMKLKTKNLTSELNAGQILVLHSDMVHSINAIEETFFLLTISTSREKNEDSTMKAKKSSAESASLYKEIF